MRCPSSLRTQGSSVTTQEPLPRLDQVKTELGLLACLFAFCFVFFNYFCWPNVFLPQSFFLKLVCIVEERLSHQTGVLLLGCRAILDHLIFHLFF